MKRKLACVALWILALVVTCFAFFEFASSIPISVESTTPRSVVEWGFGLAASTILLIMFAFVMMLLATLALGLRRV